MSDTRTYSSTTCAQYNSCIQSFQRIFADTQSTDFTIPHSLHNDSLILELLLAIHSKPTVLNYISAFLWKLRQLPSDNSPLISVYQSHSARIKEEILHDRAGTQFDLTQKESNSFLIWEDILSFYSLLSTSFDKSNFHSFQDFVIISLYVLHPPVRADYAHMRVFIDDSLIPSDFSDNYCVLQTNPRFVFQQYKTAKHKGVTTIPIDPELHDILSDFIDSFPSSFLLSSQSVKPLSESALCKRISSIFLRFAHKPVTINTLRHSFISFMSRNDQDFLRKQDNANKMMHSLSMADNYRRIVYPLPI
jgi:hypothetical protein